MTFLPGIGDRKTRTTAADTTPGFLSSKIVAGANVALAVLNPGADETLEISATGGGGAVDSVFTRTGAVVAEAGDYNASEVDNDSSVDGATVADALDAAREQTYSDTTIGIGESRTVVADQQMLYEGALTVLGDLDAIGDVTEVPSTGAVTAEIEAAIDAIPPTPVVDQYPLRVLEVTTSQTAVVGRQHRLTGSGITLTLPVGSLGDAVSVQNEGVGNILAAASGQVQTPRSGVTGSYGLDDPSDFYHYIDTFVFNGTYWQMIARQRNLPGTPDLAIVEYAGGGTLAAKIGTLYRILNDGATFQFPAPSTALQNARIGLTKGTGITTLSLDPNGGQIMFPGGVGPTVSTVQVGALMEGLAIVWQYDNTSSTWRMVGGDRVPARQLLTGISPVTAVDLALTPPTAGQVLKATSATSAAWADDGSLPYSAAVGTTLIAGQTLRSLMVGVHTFPSSPGDGTVCAIQSTSTGPSASLSFTTLDGAAVLAGAVIITGAALRIGGKPYFRFRRNNALNAWLLEGNPTYLQLARDSSDSSLWVRGLSTSPPTQTSIADGQFVGRPVGGALGAVTKAQGQAMLDIASGTYTPTLTNETNIDASTAFACQWMRVGNVVTVSGKVQIDATTVAVLTQLGLSLPVASAFTASEQCSGTGTSSDDPAEAVGVLADTVNDRARLEWICGFTANRTFHFIFMYSII